MNMVRFSEGCTISTHEITALQENAGGRSSRSAGDSPRRARHLSVRQRKDCQNLRIPEVCSETNLNGIKSP